MSSGASVLVHCAAGISRSPALAVAYIMYSLGMDLDHAYRYWVGSHRALICYMCQCDTVLFLIATVNIATSYFHFFYAQESEKAEVD